MILFTQTIHTEQTQNEENIFPSYIAQCHGWRSGAGMALTGKRREDGGRRQEVAERRGGQQQSRTASCDVTHA